MATWSVAGLVVMMRKDDAPRMTVTASFDQAVGLYPGSSVRILGVPPADGDLHQVAEELVDQKMYRYRESPTVPIKLFVIDHRHAIFPIDPLDFDRGYLEVTERHVVE